MPHRNLDADFAAAYLKAALEDDEEPRALLIALRHLAQAQGVAKVCEWPRGWSAKISR